MLSVFFEVVLPVALIAIVGAVVGRWQGVPVRPVSTLVFFLFSPALVFHSLATTEVPGDAALRIVAVGVSMFLVMYAVATAWSLAFRHDRGLRSAFALSAVTPNTGNMGLPVALLAFGQAGFDVAVVNFVVGAVLAYSAGIVIASMADGGASKALGAPFRYPVVYAAVAGVIVNVLNVDLPVTIEAPVETLAGAAVPVMLVVLGLQLHGAASLAEVRDTTAANAARLVLAPVLAWPVATALGLDGVTRDTLVVLAGMPTAVIATVVAIEFNARPDFVTRSVVLSTLLSMVTATVLITIVR
ncbi:MAG: AEC family transporter [Dehalococcoidia bacterium]|nr:AEC family transporter [Dehalococcoidia bacterium]